MAFNGAVFLLFISLSLHYHAFGVIFQHLMKKFQKKSGKMASNHRNILCDAIIFQCSVRWWVCNELKTQCDLYTYFSFPSHSLFFTSAHIFKIIITGYLLFMVAIACVVYEIILVTSIYVEKKTWSLFIKILFFAENAIPWLRTSDAYHISYHWLWEFIRILLFWKTGNRKFCANGRLCISPEMAAIWYWSEKMFGSHNTAGATATLLWGIRNIYIEFGNIHSSNMFMLIN